MHRRINTPLFRGVIIFIVLCVQIGQVQFDIYRTTQGSGASDSFSESDFFDGTILPDTLGSLDFTGLDTWGLHFTENQGQWGDHLNFISKTSFGYLGLGPDGIYYYLALGGEGHSIKISFVDSQTASILGQKDCGFASNYFYGNDHDNWIAGARSYKEVLYEDVWPKIDLLYYFKDGSLKYDIICNEQSDPSVILFQVEGAEDLVINDHVLELSISEEVVISDTELTAFYDDGTPESIRFRKIGHEIYGFDVKKKQAKQLTIDPLVLSNSTFLGGSSWEDARDIAVDSDNNIIVLGATGSKDFPNTTGAYNTTGADIVVTKMDQNASYLIFSTYLGDIMGDIPGGVEVDSLGDIYVAGLTWSRFFPTTPDVFQESDPSGAYPDVFVLKLNSLGNALIYSTYVGGTQSDYAYDLKVQSGQAYVVGSTLSYDFPSVVGGVNNPHGTALFFVLNNDGTNLTHAAFWGGWSNEFGYSIDIDKYGDVIIGGVTYSLDFPTTPSAFQRTTNDTVNGFVLKYTPSASTLVFSSYLGGDGSDSVMSLHVDDSTDIYITGITTDPGLGKKPFPTTSGAFDAIYKGGKDAYVTKMSASGSTLIHSTLIGGAGDEAVSRIELDSANRVILTGSTTSGSNFSLTPDCFDGSHNGGDDGFFVILDETGSDLVYSTFLGGSSEDTGCSCVVDQGGDIFVFGATSSSDFPVTHGSFQTQYSGNTDMFISRFRFGDLMYLHPGWNLISLPLIQGNTDLKRVLAPISGHYDSVQLYEATDPKDPWKHNNVLKPGDLNHLQSLDHLAGFFIHITTEKGVVFQYGGLPILANETIPIHPGWNLVGFPSNGMYNLTAGLNNLRYQKEIDCIQWYDASSGSWRTMDHFDYFVPGRGYWFHSIVQKDWDVPL